MNLIDWKDCLDEDCVIEVSVNREKANALFKTALARIEFLEKNKIDESSVSFIFEGFYSSALEILHAIIILNGFKVNNHICLGFFLRDEINRSDLFRKFDDGRYKRNSLMYFGKDMDYSVGKDSLENIEFLIEELKKIFEEKKNE